MPTVGSSRKMTGRAVDEGAGQREPPPLPAGERRGDRVEAVVEVDEAERLERRASRSRTPYAAAKKRAFSPTVSVG